MTDRGLGGFVSVTGGILALACAGCATVPPAPPQLPAVTVAPAAETRAVATANADAADDPAIWAAAAGREVAFGDRRVPGFVIGTDKKAGLYVYGFDGAQLQFLPEGLLNNVDLREVDLSGQRLVLIAASDRRRMGIALYAFDPSGVSGTRIEPLQFIPSDVAEPYGMCMAVVDGIANLILVGKDGQVRHYVYLPADDVPARAQEVRRFAVGTQSEGCVADEANGHLYIGEEMTGVWRYGLDPASGATREAVARVGEGQLVADVEGVTLIRDGGETYLLVSSQGDSAFAVWRVGVAAPAYVGRFRVGAANGIDAVSGTDGLDAWSGPVGPFPNGLVVVQDDQNEAAQNFKLVDWRAVRAALGF